MSLPDGQERILSGIEAALRACEPRLASRFAVFTRLNRDEQLPRREQIVLAKPWLKRVAGACRASFRSFRLAWRAGGAPRPARGRVAAGFRMAVLIPLALVVTASAVVAASLSANTSCARVASHPGVATARWNTCAVSGAPARGTRTAGGSAQGTPR
ncbi:MAG TPA: hypothetical protein VEC76_10975 [Streptosporangiaceae bacterium]|nr:hypothetical protein [Streptosporangiaceae bacterium]